MKKKKIYIALTAILVLALTVASASAAFASEQEPKSKTEAGSTKELRVCDGGICDGSVCDGAGNSYEDFIREMKGLTEDERAALAMAYTDKTVAEILAKYEHYVENAKKSAKGENPA